MKSCGHSDCKQTNPQELRCFSKNKSAPDGLQHYCKKCCSKASTDWRIKNKERNNANARNRYYKDLEKHRKRVRDKHFVIKYGLTKEDIEVMRRQQNGKCKICDTSKKLVVDHCHKTGKVRGLLCYNCNTAIGKLYEKEELFLKAIKYLKGV